MMKKSKQYEAGSIMLEVVAVLALMGVMGAMLFRQIYQRNQELHNIQMASEIRTVKEAFSAYIQANRSSILATNCTTIPSSDDVVQCTGGNFDDIYDGVAYYLPDGWFDGEDLEGAYTLSLWNYLIENDSEKRIVYGIVVPTTDTLPTTGWNFKRAARVALLIGADGGAYDPTITKCSYNNSKECIAGALGAWEIESSGIFDADTYPDGTYVATTGIDLFAPEYELPEGKVGIPAEWNLALQNLHAYSYFSVGNAGDSDCYSIETDTTPGGRSIRKYDGAGENAVVESDTVSPGLSDDCKPLFWVGSEIGGVNASSGNVYVATDLKIGDIIDDAGTKKHNEALTLTKEGVIKQKDGLIIDADGRIIANETVSAAIGDLASGEHFVLDPAYTSTMMDIRLASRGGARLSDILPNYILKEQEEKTGLTSYTITKPNCPKGYKKALAIIPTSWPKTELKVDIPQLYVDIANEKTGFESDVDVKNGVGLCVKVGTTEKATDEATDTGNWSISLGLHNGTDCTANSSIKAIAQTYCVWEPSLYDGNENACKAAGYVYSSGNCTTTHAVDTDTSDAVVGAERSEKSCKEAGFIWVNTADKERCQYSHPTVTIINGYGAGIDKEKACKAAGYTWNTATNNCE